jgi:hypothetical protein
MIAKPLHATLIGAAAFLSTIAPILAFAEFEETEWTVQDLYKQCTGAQGSLEVVFCLEFVSNVARQVFTNRLTLREIRNPADLGFISSACPKSLVSNDAIVKAFSEWANQHLEKWSASAQTGVVQAMRDTWPCV